ncbi:sensor histidine kinase [Vagococcus entomophilus]|uniref:histidine kinase n=1 Tax=Vagococcus entomophilus TaxID=1160095 RepID=A0A430AFM4_9ENTE|nr:sensor histidine kinase [Vagococcus entomophilus]RSU06519.1 histidine kinase [Vagococcus entomophilus]
MSFLHYLKDQATMIIFWLICIFLTVLIFWLTPDFSLPFTSLLYIFLLQFAFLVAFLTFSYIKRYPWWKTLGNEQVEKEISILPLNVAVTNEQKLAQQTINDLIDKHHSSLETILHAQQEQKDFIDSWVHEIKVPLAAIQLIIENISDDIPEKNLYQLENDLQKINSYVEQVLYFSRLDSFSKDYLIQEHSLKSIIYPTIRQSANYFIQHQLHYSVSGEDYEVLTDPKWLAFILEQIISNAIKYTEDGGSITFDISKNERGVWLAIQDTGIGIPLEDQRRIFDKGFTGQNGRNLNQHATGLGLYLARNLAGKLGHSIYVDSEVGTGTTIRILFPFLTYYTEADEESLL